MESFQIKDSYKVHSKAMMEYIIDGLQRKDSPPAPIACRTIESLVREWCGHNLLYDLHIARGRTTSVDFEYPQRWYYATIWYVLSLFYWHR